MQDIIAVENIKNELKHFETGRIYALEKWNKIMRIMAFENGESKDVLFSKIKEDTLKQIEFYRTMIDTRKEILTSLENE